jgi:hypothetical protein
MDSDPHGDIIEAIGRGGAYKCMHWKIALRHGLSQGNFTTFTTTLQLTFVAYGSNDLFRDALFRALSVSKDQCEHRLRCLLPQLSGKGINFVVVDPPLKTVAVLDQTNLTQSFGRVQLADRRNVRRQKILFERAIHCSLR